MGALSVLSFFRLQKNIKFPIKTQGRLFENIKKKIPNILLSPREKKKEETNVEGKEREWMAAIPIRVPGIQVSFHFGYC